MNDDNKRNLHYFESHSMQGLFEVMDEWQQKNNKRLLSTNIQPENGKFCCIALTNPTEVIICDGEGSGRKATVGRNGDLWVTT